MVNSKPRAISFLALFIVCVVFLVALLSVLEVFDPLPDRELIWQEELQAMHVPPKSAEQRWLKEELPLAPLEIRLTAAYGGGEIDSGYGLILGQDEGSISIMISPLGYAAVSQQRNSDESGAVDFLMPWQTWPHIHTGDDINELLVYLDGDRMTVRINREWFWEGANIEAIRAAGVIGESFGEAVMINFHSAEISAVESSQ
ncbi:MAG: hypothetical protein ACK2UR_20330 [Candidatus Promineifilaceae bacterium]